VSKIRAFLVDDHTVVRQGLRRLLESDDAIAVVGEASSGRAAVEMVQEIQPHVVVMDVGLPELNGVEATRQIVKRLDGTRVLILTMHGDDVYVRQSLRAGAHGYVLKDADGVDLIQAVKTVGTGGSFFSPEIARVMLEDYLGDGDRDDDDKIARLTDREREVMQLIAEGRSSKEVANLLSLSVYTVDTHRKHIMEKLDLRNTAELVRFAIRSKVVH
jgi:DNA-binding NarL/FixJ family response regulator